MLVQVHTCKNGEYSPITVHGIVDEDKGPATTTTTELPVTFYFEVTITCF